MAQGCSVELCTGAVAGYLRFVDVADQQGCRAHFGSGLTFKFPVCEAHYQQHVTLGADHTRWAQASKDTE